MTQNSEAKQPRGRGLGTIIACFVVAAVVVGVIDHDEPRVRRAEARDLAAREDAAEREAADSEPADRATFKINKGHVIVEPTNGDMKIDMDEDLRRHVQVKTSGQRVTITVDDDYEDDVKIKLAVPSSSACRVELAAGLLEVKRPPCQNNDLIVRSGKMEVDNVSKNHGALSGAVSVGTVTIKGANGQQSKSSGVGDLRANLPAAGDGPVVNAVVNVGMLTIDVE